MKKIIVVSGVNIFRGGPLKVMREFLSALSSFVNADSRIIALVCDRRLYPEYDNVEYLTFPKSRKSWLFRLYYEYLGFRKLSVRLKPYCWISLHDTTPNVVAEKRMVYCHSAFPFYKAGWKDFRLQREIFMFSKFTRYIYQINIKKNDVVIVQQQWLKDALHKMFSLNNIIVSLPGNEISLHPDIDRNQIAGKQEKSKTVFFYPAGAMIHKNFEVVCEAAALLEKEGAGKFEVIITIKGSENRYAEALHRKYGAFRSISFSGYTKSEEMPLYYQYCDCLLFASKAETWGLPISEAKEFDKPVFAADLPYAHETAGKYNKVKFFDPDDILQLAKMMKDFISGNIIYDETQEIRYEEPFARNWQELFGKILQA